MTMKDLSEIVSRYSKLLPLNQSISTVDAEKKASEFLVALAELADLKHAFMEQKIKLVSLHTSVYAEEMSKGTSKTMTENKLVAEASKAYISARESMENIENDINYIKSYYEIFLNAHLFYRTMAKENS